MQYKNCLYLKNIDISSIYIFCYAQLHIHKYRVKFIYFEKATKFCEIVTVDLTIKNKSKVVISQNFCVLLTKPQLYIGTYIICNVL